MLDDGALFKAMRVAGNNGAMTCVHAENGPVIDVLVRGAGAGPACAEMPRDNAPLDTRGENSPRHRWRNWLGLRSPPCTCPRASAVRGDERAIAGFYHAETARTISSSRPRYDKPGFEARSM
jgi:hypothetical protein